jgi:hypothetical protein
LANQLPQPSRLVSHPVATGFHHRPGRFTQAGVANLLGAWGADTTRATNVSLAAPKQYDGLGQTPGNKDVPDPRLVTAKS